MYAPEAIITVLRCDVVPTIFEARQPLRIRRNPILRHILKCYLADIIMLVDLDGMLLLFPPSLLFP